MATEERRQVSKSGKQEEETKEDESESSEERQEWTFKEDSTTWGFDELVLSSASKFVDVK